MVSILRPFILIAKAVRAFFKSDLRVRRGDRGLELVLDEPLPKAAKVKGKHKLNPVAEREKLELKAILDALARLLGELPENRAAMRHLAFIEHALDKKGLRALHKVPVDVLKRALDQLEGLVVNWSDEGLATLRSKMAVTLIEREPEGKAAASPAGAPTSIMDSAPLAHPVTLEGEDADEAEAALRAAYGAMVLPDLDLETVEEPALEVHGELSSPSGKALAKAARRASDAHA